MLLVGRNTLIVLDLSLYLVDRVGGFDFEHDRLAGDHVDEILHATAETKGEVHGGFLLNVVVRKRAAILQLLARKAQMLLVGRDTTGKIRYR